MACRAGEGRTADSGPAARQRIDSLLELIDAYDGEIDLFRAMIAGGSPGTAATG